MAKKIKVLDTLPNGFITVEFTDGTDKVTVSVPPLPVKVAGVDNSEDELLNYFSQVWPHNEFETMRAPTAVSLDSLKNKVRTITTRVEASDQARAASNE